MRHPGDNLRRCDWLVERVAHGEAVAAIHAWHYSHSAPNTGQTYGLYRRNELPLAPLMGAALWLPPTRRAAEAVAGEGWRGVLSLSRLAVAPGAPRNAATYLLAASMRLLDRQRWPVLVTYADTHQGHTGAIYKATGWHLDAITNSGSYFVKDGRQVGRKRGSHNIPAAQLRAEGYVEVKADKLRFVHRPAASITGAERPAAAVRAAHVLSGGGHHGDEQRGQAVPVGGDEAGGRRHAMPGLRAPVGSGDATSGRAAPHMVPLDRPREVRERARSERLPASLSTSVPSPGVHDHNWITFEDDAGRQFCDQEGCGIARVLPPVEGRDS